PPVSSHFAPRKSQTASASFFRSRLQAPSPPRLARNAAPPATPLRYLIRTAGSPSLPASRFSVLLLIPHAARHKLRPRSSASRCQKSRDQIPLDRRPNAEWPLSKHAPPDQSRSPPKTLPYTAPSASALPTQ